MGERMSRTKKIFGMVGICRLSDLDDISGRNDELYSRAFHVSDLRGIWLFCDGVFDGSDIDCGGKCTCQCLFGRILVKRKQKNNENHYAGIGSDCVRRISFAEQMHAVMAVLSDGDYLESGI